MATSPLIYPMEKKKSGPSFIRKYTFLSLYLDYTPLLEFVKGFVRQLPTFAGKPTIIGLGRFHFRVRDGNGWSTPSVVALRKPRLTQIIKQYP